MTISFTIPGAPRTKKNHGRRIKRGNMIYHVQSVAHEEWNAAMQLWLAKVRTGCPFGLPLGTPVHVSALFYRHADVGDLNGYQQALGDALEQGRIIANDKLIHSWDGTRLLKDAARPRIEVQITEL